jgi:putative heme degradation protein
MKITKQYLKQIIEEELKSVSEQVWEPEPARQSLPAAAELEDPALEVAKILQPHVDCNNVDQIWDGLNQTHETAEVIAVLMQSGVPENAAVEAVELCDSQNKAEEQAGLPMGGCGINDALEILCHDYSPGTQYPSDRRRRLSLHRGSGMRPEGGDTMRFPAMKENMKITKQQLKQLIEEEFAKTLDLEESSIEDIPGENFQLAVVKKLDEIMAAVNNLPAKLKR